jgi:hypothetical protein
MSVPSRWRALLPVRRNSSGTNQPCLSIIVQNKSKLGDIFNNTFTSWMDFPMFGHVAPQLCRRAHTVPYRLGSAGSGWADSGSNAGMEEHSILQVREIMAIQAADYWHYSPFSAITSTTSPEDVLSAIAERFASICIGV